MHYRIMLIVIQGLLPGSVVSFFWVPWSGSHYLSAPLIWLLLAAATAAFWLLGTRTWRESATITADQLIVRNVFSDRRIPLADITGVRFRRSAGLIVMAAGRPQGGGRHAGAPKTTVAAVKLGTAYLTGRRAGADDAADAIATAAGLPPLPARAELLSVRAARLMAPLGVALLVLADWVGQSTIPGSLIPSWRDVLARMVGFVSALLLLPSAAVLIDGFFGRWRGASRS